MTVLGDKRSITRDVTIEHDLGEATQLHAYQCSMTRVSSMTNQRNVLLLLPLGQGNRQLQLGLHRERYKQAHQVNLILPTIWIIVDMMNLDVINYVYIYDVGN